MAAVKVNPQKLAGPWTEGYVLDRHTVSSTFVGHDAFGNPQFETKRTELGELIFRLKNRNDRRTIDVIAETAERFLQTWKPGVDLVIPVPPSRRRALQPVLEIAQRVGARLSKPVGGDVVKKVRATPELKNVFAYGDRIKVLEDAFEVSGELRNRRILLVDDLYRSGATLKAVTRKIQEAGAASVYVLVMTRTRTRL